MKNKLLAILAVGLLAGTGLSHAGVIDFEEPGNALLPGGGAGTFDGSTIVSGGCTFTSPSGPWSGLENGVDGADNGTTHFFGSDVTMTCGQTFTLVSFDLGEDYPQGTGSVPQSFEFFVDVEYAGGGIFTDSTFTLGDFVRWIEVPADLWTNLVSVRWYTQGNGDDGVPFQFALDNIRTVPEPGTMALLGLGLLGLGFSRRRKTA